MQTTFEFTRDVTEGCVGTPCCVFLIKKRKMAICHYEILHTNTATIYTYTNQISRSGLYVANCFL